MTTLQKAQIIIARMKELGIEEADTADLTLWTEEELEMFVEDCAKEFLDEPTTFH